MTLNIEIIADEKTVSVKIDEATFFRLLRDHTHVAAAVQVAMHAFKSAMDYELGETKYSVSIPAKDAINRINQRR